jgi:hypothetical protein
MKVVNRLKSKLLKSIIKNINFSKVNWIKIDVKYSEMQVLEGFQETLRKGVKCLMVEVHSEENKTKAISFIKSLGYKVISLKTPREERNTYFSSFNEFLICKRKFYIKLNFSLQNCS